MTVTAENCRKQFGSAVVPGDGDTKRQERGRERKERHFRPIKTVKGRANHARGRLIVLGTVFLICDEYFFLSSNDFINLFDQSFFLSG